MTPMNASTVYCNKPGAGYAGWLPGFDGDLIGLILWFRIPDRLRQHDPLFRA